MNLDENQRRHGEAIASFTRVLVTEPKSVDVVEAPKRSAALRSAVEATATIVVFPLLPTAA